MRRGWNFAQRSRRGGRGLLPPNPKQWNNEHNGLDVREELGLPLEVPVPHASAYELLAHVRVFPLGQLPAELRHIGHLRGPAAAKWSGLAVRVADDLEIVVFNDAHPLSRIRATLMEEFFHIWLDHPRSALRFYGPDGASRSFDRTIEEEAYGSGAAALVPYATLKQMVGNGWSVTRVARHFQVSRDLVLFRAKVTKIYKLLRATRSKPA